MASPECFRLTAPPTGQKPIRLEVALPANSTLLQAILDHPDVQAIQLNKERPACVGVRRGGKFSWWFRDGLHEALEAAKEGLKERPKPAPEDEP